MKNRWHLEAYRKDHESQKKDIFLGGNLVQLVVVYTYTKGNIFFHISKTREPQGVTLSRMKPLSIDPSTALLTL